MPLFPYFSTIKVTNATRGVTVEHRLPDYVGGPRCSEDYVPLMMGDRFIITGVEYAWWYDNKWFPAWADDIHLYVGACGRKGGGYLFTTKSGYNGVWGFDFVIDPYVMNVIRTSEEPTFFVHIVDKWGNEGYSGEVHIKPLFDRYAEITVWNKTTNKFVTHLLPDYVGGRRCSEDSVSMAKGESIRAFGKFYAAALQPLRFAPVHLYVGACGRKGGGYYASSTTDGEGKYSFDFEVDDLLIKLIKSSEEPTLFVHSKDANGEGYSGEVHIKYIYTEEEKSQVLTTRPNWEPVTYFGHIWYKHLVTDYAAEKGFKVVDLVGDDANRETFVRAIRDSQPRLVCGEGHGNETCFTGQRYDILLQRGDQVSAELLDGKIFSAISCEFGQSAKWFVAKGCSAFMGYTSYFWISFTVPIWSPPEKVLADEVQRAYFESHCEFERKLIDGYTAGEAYIFQEKKYLEELDKMAYPTAKYFLWANYSVRTFEGDQYAALQPMKVPTPKSSCPYGAAGFIFGSTPIFERLSERWERR
jgi:hypothetical protein